MFNLDELSNVLNTYNEASYARERAQKIVDQTTNDIKAIQPQLNQYERRLKELYDETGISAIGTVQGNPRFFVSENNHPFIHVVIQLNNSDVIESVDIPLAYFNDAPNEHLGAFKYLASRFRTVYKIKCNKKERFFAAYYRKGNGNWKESVVNKSAGLLDNFWAIQGEEKYAYVFFDKEQAEIAANAMCSSIKEFNRQFVSIERYDDFDIANYQEKTLKCADFDDHNKIYTFTGYVNIEDFKNWQNSLS